MQTDSTLARTANKMFEKCDQEREYKEKADQMLVRIENDLKQYTN